MRQRGGRNRDTRRSPSSRKGTPGTTRWRGVLLAALVVLAAVAAAVWLRTAGRQEPAPPRGDRTARAPEEPPPVDPAVVLGVAPEPPQKVEALKDEALAACRRLVSDLPVRPQAHAVMAITLMRLGQTDPAVEAWQECLKLDRDFAPALLGLGKIAADRAQYDEAADYVWKSVERAADPTSAYSLLTEILLQQGKTDEALQIARTHVARVPDSAEAHFWLGQVWLEMQRYDEAQRSHERAVELRPEFTSAYHSLGIAAARRGQREQAAAYRKKFAELKQNDLARDRGRNRQYRDLPAQQEIAATVYRSAGDVYADAGNLRLAEAHWLRGAAVAPQETACRAALLALYERQDRPQAALRVVEPLLTGPHADADLWTRAGQLYARLGRFESAEQAFRRAIEENPQAAEACFGLAEVLISAGRDAAEYAPWAEKAAALAPSVQTCLLAAAVRHERGDRRGALAAVEQAMRLDPGNPQVQRAYAELKANQ